MHEGANGAHPRGAVYLVIVRYVEGGSPEYSVRINKSSVASGSSAFDPSTSNPTGALALGCSTAGTTSLDGQIAEAGFANRYWTDAEVTALEAYAARYGI